MDHSGTDIDRSGNTSGFDEKTSTSGSSGIESSEHSNQLTMPQQIHVYYTSSEDDSYETDDVDEELDEEEEDDDESEHYFNTDDEAEEEEDSAHEEELFESQQDTATTTTLNHSINSSNTLNNDTPDSLNLAYQSAYSRWVDLYWNQMTLVQDYVKFFNFTRQQ